MEYLKKVFERVDNNNTGKITKEELEKYYLSLGITVTKEKVQKIVSECDFNDTGHIKIQEFICATLDVHKLADTKKG